MLRHVDLVVTWLSFLLIGLTLLAITVLVESRSNTTCTAAHGRLLFLNHIVLVTGASQRQDRVNTSVVRALRRLDDIEDGIGRRSSRTILIKKVKYNCLIDGLLEELIVHDKHSSIR